MAEQDFVHLHVHTEFSLLDGLSKINKLVGRASKLEMASLAITDHGTMFGVIDFYRACKAAGIKPIIGVEAYLARRTMYDRDSKEDTRPYHMLLLAKNETGYKNLLKMSSAAQLEGFYYRPRIDRELMAAHAEGVIATSGCLAAEIPRMIEMGNDEEARNLIGWYQEVFGKENFYLELQQHDIPELETLNKWLVEYSRTHHTNVPLIATNDVHYVMKADHTSQDTLLCIQTSALKSDQNRMKMSDPSYHLTSQAEMWEFFHEVPEALTNTLDVAAMCDVNLDTEGYHLPIFPVPPGHDGRSYLHYLCEIGMDWRFGSRKDDPVLRKRLEKELGIIHDMGFDTYFLIVWDLCEYARHADIWWNVRGSGAGSLAAYCLGITNIDPIQNNLLFERFLNPGRVSMPDIDLDYPDDRRAEMIAYTAQKYGEDKVAAIITFGTMGAKAAVRDVGRALDVDLSKVNEAARLIPTEARQKPLMTYVEDNPELKALYDKDEQIHGIIDTAKELQGVVRHASTHAAGVIVADKPLVDYIPLHRITGTDPSGGSLKAVTQFPMETCESIGLLKVDFLGLSTLTILRKACDLIEKHRGIQYTMNNIPYRHDADWLTDEDRQRLTEAFDLIGRGETVGVFQVESSGMQQMLREMRPSRFEHIIAAISLYRPGPMDYIPTYTARMQGKEEVIYHHEALRPILEETFGIITYQEQIMQIAGQLFGYELGEADLMRRAVSKKKAKDLKKHKDIFLERGPELGIDEETSAKIFDDIEFFANYGFNKSHAADYAVITVQTAFLKTHYPEEYMTGLLTVQQDNSDKVATFLEECRRLGIPVLPPNINHSMLDFDIETMPDGKRGIRFGLAAIKNAGVGPLQYLLEAREEKGAFANIEDLCRRANLHTVQKRTLESMIKVGALCDLGERPVLLAGMERMISFSADYHRDKEVGQMTMFGEESAVADSMLENLPDVEPVSDRQMLQWEKELLGLYVTGRPVDKFRNELQASGTDSIQQLKEAGESKHDKPVRVAGEVVVLRKIITSKNDLMAVIQLEDWHDTAGSLDVVLFPRTWAKFQDDVDEGKIIMVTGKFDVSRGDPQIICDKVLTDFSVMTAENMPLYSDDSPPEWMNGEPDFTPQSASQSAPPWEDEGFPPPPIDEPPPPIYSDPMGEPLPPAVNGNNGKVVPPWPEGDSDLDGESETLQRTLLIHFLRSDDTEKDQRRLRKLHGKLVSYPGKDRFIFVVYNADGSSRTIEFPKHTTKYCERLIRELEVIVGEGNVEVLD